MVLEANMICIDNSEWMRNEDYSPSRFQAQVDSAFLIIGAKTQSNPESAVGILTMAGKRVRVLTTPTSDLGKILVCMHDVEIGGEVNMSAAIQIAQLALKHRQNKNQQQKIIVFAGSPIKCDKKTLELIGKKLRKNSVSLDIVNFGEEDDEKTEKLEALLAAVNNNENSHIVHIPPGPNSLSDVLMSTPTFNGDTETSGGGDFEFGVDPNIDPELALALRISMDEERARQEEAAKSDVSRLNKNDPKSAAELDRSKDELFEGLLLGLTDTPESIDGVAKDESRQLYMSMDVEDDHPSMPFDLNEPPAEELLASWESQSECEEKKKGNKPPNDEN